MGKNATVDYLRDLSDRIGFVPVMHGVDQWDMQVLSSIAAILESKDVDPSMPWWEEEFRRRKEDQCG